MHLFDRLYSYLLGESMGPEIRKFVASLGYLSLSAVIGGGSIFVFTILAGRLLGPTHYGQYSLVTSIANFAIIPMLMGFNLSVVKRLSKGANTDILTTSFLSVSLFVACTVGLMLLFHNFFTKLFNIPYQLLVVAIIFSAILTFYILIKSFLQGLKKFKLYAIYEIIFSLVTLISFILLVFVFKMREYTAPAGAQSLGYLLAIIVVLILLAKNIKSMRFVKSHFNELLGYGVYVGLTGIFGYVLGNIDRLVINHYQGASSVGLYAAYFTTPMIIISQILLIFTTAFFPIACKYNDKSKILKKLNTITLKTILVVPFINFIIVSAIVFLFGKQYPYNLPIALMFSASATFFIYYNVYSWLMASEGRRGVKLTTYGVILASIIVFLLNIILVPKWGIYGSAVATAITNFLLLVYFIKISQKTFKGTYA